MKALILSINLLLMATAPLLFDFTIDTDLAAWRVVDDVVMGGRSDGHFKINEAGNGLFYGEVSLENNGGFSSVRHRFSAIPVGDYSHCVIRLKGDGRRYQLRFKSSLNDAHSYIYYFTTSGEWEEITVPLAEMYPTFRGRKLRMPNYPGEQLAEVAFLIGNKEAQTFRLELDYLRLE
ncbi:CIA30 family protein [Lewinella sp. LCG006]|uniref:CIA30 family protein n=1 Tax=Lewinella sp. LCG006 TaxID=3231911 RepID=UPI00345F7C0E